MDWKSSSRYQKGEQSRDQIQYREKKKKTSIRKSHQKFSVKGAEVSLLSCKRVEPFSGVSNSTLPPINCFCCKASSNDLNFKGFLQKNHQISTLPKFMGKIFTAQKCPKVSYCSIDLMDTKRTETLKLSRSIDLSRGRWGPLEAGPWMTMVSHPLLYGVINRSHINKSSSIVRSFYLGLIIIHRVGGWFLLPIISGGYDLSSNENSWMHRFWV